jgi:hypothetical protein
MRNSVAVVFLFAAVGAAQAVRAQDETSKMELYGGYDYTRFNIDSNASGQPPSQTFNGNGGGGQMAFNVTRWLGVLGDVGGYWATNATKQGAAIPYLLGPRLNLRRHIVTPFAQVLVGGVVTSSGIEEIGWQNHFAMTTGGGIDVRASKHLSIPPASRVFPDQNSRWAERPAKQLPLQRWNLPPFG